MKLRRTIGMALLAASMATACSKPPQPAVSVLREITVGAHRVTARVPANWVEEIGQPQVTLKAPPPTDEEQRRQDYKGELSWASFAEVIMRDLGPVPPAPLATLVDQALPSLHRDSRREVASRTAVTVDGAEAEELKLWDRLTHNAPQHLLFFENGGSLFLLTHTLPGREHSIAAYEAMRASLRLVREASPPRIAR